jgi:twitching motility protein PilT
MINKILEILKKNPKISDIHLRGGTNIAYRTMGDIIIDKSSKVENKDVEELLKKNCSESEIQIFNTKKELDCAVTLGELRFRANFYKTLTGTAAVFRKVETKIPSMDSLGLPNVLYELVDAHKGLVLVTGPTGSGKSTTLASIIDQINENRPVNIITIEDPVEFIHNDKKSIISQREVGKQTESFAKALKGALREDPDVILVGELRDLETIGMALTAAETGHLVFATLHTSGASSTINRLIDVFPAEQQSQIRSQISESLKMAITQNLFKKKDGSGRVAAFEIMVCNPAIRNLIRESKIHQIPSVMQTGQRDGMITMDKSIDKLIDSGTIANVEKL